MIPFRRSFARDLRLAVCAAVFVTLRASPQEQKPPDPAVAPAASQEPKPSGPIASPVTERKGPYVRKFSMGANFSFLAWASIPDASVTQTVASDLSIESWADAKRRLFGGGIVWQTTLTPRLALSGGMLFRRLDFTTTAITYEGVDDTDTTDDERTATLKQTTTRARLLDIPLVLRRYSKDHSRRGRRYFYEGGMAMRLAHGVRSFGVSTDQAGTETCCDEATQTPAHRVLPGFVAGAGIQFIDEFGIRIVPEVRYTRWLWRTFDSGPARSGMDQLEFGLSLTF